MGIRYRLDGLGIESRWGARFSAPVRTGPGAHPASYTMGTGSFPGVKRPGRGVDHPRPTSADVEGRVELYICSHSGPSWPVLGRPLPLLYQYWASCFPRCGLKRVSAFMQSIGCLSLTFIIKRLYAILPLSVFMATALSIFPLIELRLFYKLERNLAVRLLFVCKICCAPAHSQTAVRSLKPPVPNFVTIIQFLQRSLS